MFTRMQALSVHGREQPETLQATRAPATTLDVLEQFGTRSTVDQGELIFCRGDRADSCYRIISGHVRMVRLIEDGRRQITDFLRTGDLIGFESEGRHDFSAEAITDVEVICYPRRSVEALEARRGGVTHNLRDMMALRLCRAYSHMLLLGRKTAAERIASFLLELADRNADITTTCIYLPMSRQDIADYLGLTVETVSRQITHLRETGIIEMLSPAGIKIRTHAVLKEIAEASEQDFAATAEYRPWKLAAD